MKIAIQTLVCVCLMSFFLSFRSDAATDVDISTVKCRVEFDSGNTFVYTGESIEPQNTEVIISDQEGCETVLPHDTYRLKFAHNIDPGTASVTICALEGSGYCGEILIENAFEIVLGSPENLKIDSFTYNKIRMSWEKVQGADGYAIYRSTSSGGKYSNVATVSASKSRSYTDLQVKIGSTYYYRVAGYKVVDGKKVFGGDSPTVKQKASLPLPVISKVSSSSYNSIKISWGKVSGSSGYGIYRSTSAKGTYTRIGTAKGGSTNYYIDKKRSCGKTYYYKVRAYRTVNKTNYYGGYSDVKSGRSLPSKTTFYSNPVKKYTSITLSWKKAAGAQGYEIYRCTSYSGKYERVKTITKSGTTKWTNSKLTSDKVYYYKIRSFCTVSGTRVYSSFSLVIKKDKISARVANLKKYKGRSYVYGGCSTRGWDCSGFSRWAMKYVGNTSVPRTAYQQSKGGTYVNPKKMSSWKPGDILCFARNGRINHVAVYLGNGKMIHALNSKYDTIIQDVKYYQKWDRKNKLVKVRRYL